MFSWEDGMGKKNTVFKNTSDEVKTICNFHCKCHQDDRISNISNIFKFCFEKYPSYATTQERKCH